MTPSLHEDIVKITDKAARDICSVAIAPAAKSTVRAIILSAITEVLEEKATKPSPSHSKLSINNHSCPRKNTPKKILIHLK